MSNEIAINNCINDLTALDVQISNLHEEFAKYHREFMMNNDELKAKHTLKEIELARLNGSEYVSSNRGQYNEWMNIGGNIPCTEELQVLPNTEVVSGMKPLPGESQLDFVKRQADNALTIIRNNQ